MRKFYKCSQNTEYPSKHEEIVVNTYKHICGIIITLYNIYIILHKVRESQSKILIRRNVKIFNQTK